MDRQHATQTVTDLIEDLTIRVLITEHYTYSPTRQHGEWANQPLPARHPIHLKREDPPLIKQLQNLTSTALASAGSHEPVKRSKPGSRPPLNLDQYDTLERLTRDAQYWRDMYTLHKGHTPKPAPVGGNLTALRHITLDPDTPDQLIEQIIHGLKSYRNEALIRLNYVAPMTTFRDMFCHICGGTLRARTDATGDVHCAGGNTLEGPAQQGDPWPIVNPGCGNKYGKHAWLEILTHNNGAA